MKPHVSMPDLQKTDILQCGYVQLFIHGCHAVALDWSSSTVEDALDGGTLHEWASIQPLREEMRGRGTVYAVDLPVNPPVSVVVRRNRHGGLLGSLTGEYFLTPTRAPLELSTSLRLAAAGIATPEVIAYAIYPAAGIFARSDVMTRRLPAGNDFPAAWMKANKTDRDLILLVTESLLVSLANAEAWHADLNLKNIYIAGTGPDMTAYLLDVDRVTFPGGVDIAGRNFRRLERSARKWRTRWGLDFDEKSLAQLAVHLQEKR